MFEAHVDAAADEGRLHLWRQAQLELEQRLQGFLALLVARVHRDQPATGLAQRLIQGLAREVQALAVNTHALMHKDAPGRLAQWLHQRCVPLPGCSGQAMVKLTDRKRDVASQLAITPETLSRLMRSFSRQGLIEVAGYNVRVIDPVGLARLGQV